MKFMAEKLRSDGTEFAGVEKTRIARAEREGASPATIFQNSIGFSIFLLERLD